MTLALTARTAARATQLDHVHAWDWLRVLAMLDIAGLHLRGEHLFAGMGLPLFHMLSVALSVSGARPPDTRAFARVRARRFLLPWLFWSALFACLRAVDEALHGRSAWSWCQPRMLLYGPIIALWFLPFTALAGLAAHAGQHLLQRRAREPLALVLLFCTALLLVPLAPGLALGWPFEQWLFSIPSALFGFVIGRSCSLLGVREQIGGRLMLGSAVLGAATLALWPFDPAGARHLVRFLLAFSLITGALWLPDRKYAFSESLRPLLLGVYILHPVLYQHLLDAPIWQLGWGRMGWVRLSLGVGVSAACVWLLRRTPLRRFV